MKSILDPSFEYTSSVHTDIRKTFERVWREMATHDEGLNPLDGLRAQRGKRQIELLKDARAIE